MAQGIRKIGIVGAGQMGNGIAHVCALAGIPVVLNDVVSARLKDALATINGLTVNCLRSVRQCDSNSSGTIDRGYAIDRRSRKVNILLCSKLQRRCRILCNSN